MPRNQSASPTMLSLRDKKLIGAALALCVLAIAACQHASTNNTTSIGSSQQINATVLSVTDGDTIKVTYGGTEDRVRLIGIDTPETHGKAGLRECYGEQASQRLKELLPAGTAVTLKTDVEPRDRYDRLLAYVYRDSDGLFINLSQVSAGYAAAFAYPPNTRYVADFATAASSAKQRDLGLWGECGGPDAPIARTG